MIRSEWLAAAAAVALLPAMASAQSMAGMPMPGMKMPANPAAKSKSKARVRVVAKRPAPKPAQRARRAGAPADPAGTAGMDMRPATPPPPGAAPAAEPTMPGMDMPPSGTVPSAPSRAMPGMTMPEPADNPPQSMEGMKMPAPPAGTPPTLPITGSMAGMDMSKTGDTGSMAMPDMDGRPGEGSGTSRIPAAGGAMLGLHIMSGDWMLMLHGYAWGVYTDQSGPRGRDKAFSTSMAMFTASRDLGGGASLSLRTMLSLDALMGPRGYRSLLATGETADGVTPLVDRQHPHDLFMELAAKVEVPIAGDLHGFVYGGPVAEPALGPSAFMHRTTAKYLPLAPITHHWFDSTHITFGVITAGLNTAHWQLEGSAFRGREPDQHRWDIETPKLDSWSVRATWNPSQYWSAQVSYGWLKSPESLEPGQNEARTTASVQYARGGFSALVGYGVKNRLPGRALSAWLGEANWDIGRHHSVFGRVENLANDELFPNPLDPLHDRKFRVTRAELGYAYRIPVGDKASIALGGTGFVIAKPAALDAAYGKLPAGWTGFVKVSLGG